MGIISILIIVKWRTAMVELIKLLWIFIMALVLYAYIYIVCLGFVLTFMGNWWGTLLAITAIALAVAVCMDKIKK